MLLASFVPKPGSTQQPVLQIYDIDFSNEFVYVCMLLVVKGGNLVTLLLAMFGSREDHGLRSFFKVLFERY